MFENELGFASRAFMAGNLAASEIVCRDIVDADPRNVAALNQLGEIARQLKANEHAARLFEAVLEVDPGNKNAQMNLQFSRGRSRRWESDEKRYLVIKAWGYGFWSDMAHVLGSLLLAEITGRTPVIHLGNNSLYSDGLGTDVFGTYFQPVSDVTLQDLTRIEGARFFPHKWNRSNLASEDINKWQGEGARLAALYFLNRPETIAVSDFYVGALYVQPWIPASHPMHGKPLDEIHRYLIDKYLHLKLRCRQAVDEFFSRHLQGAPFVAIHMRGADKILEDPDVQARQEACLAELATVDPSWRILLLTDDTPIAGRLKAEYGDRIVLTDSQRSSSTVGVHCNPAADRIRAGFEVVVDTFLGARADRFIGTGRSNISTLIAAMKEWPPGHCTILGSRQIAERNLHLFR